MVAILPAVVVHTGVAINLTPYKGIYWQLLSIILCTNPVFQSLLQGLTFCAVLLTPYSLLQAFDLGMWRSLRSAVVSVLPHVCLAVRLLCCCVTMLDRRTV